MNRKHMIYGSALYHITQHPAYSVMQAVNDRTYLVQGQVVYLKHACKPTPQGEYHFTFRLPEVELLDDLRRKHGNVHLVLLCVQARAICCLPYVEFERIWSLRQVVAGDLEEQFSLKVLAPAGKSFRVNADYPGRRKVYLSRPTIVPRTDFPNRIFLATPAAVPA